MGNLLRAGGVGRLAEPSACRVRAVNATCIGRSGKAGRGLRVQGEMAVGPGGRLPCAARRRGMGGQLGPEYRSSNTSAQVASLPDPRLLRCSALISDCPGRAARARLCKTGGGMRIRSQQRHGSFGFSTHTTVLPQIRQRAGRPGNQESTPSSAAGAGRRPKGAGRTCLRACTRARVVRPSRIREQRRGVCPPIGGQTVVSARPACPLTALLLRLSKQHPRPNGLTNDQH